jgi:hypothetical protein
LPQNQRAAQRKDRRCDSRGKHQQRERIVRPPVRYNSTQAARVEADPQVGLLFPRGDDFPGKASKDDVHEIEQANHHGDQPDLK